MAQEGLQTCEVSAKVPQTFSECYACHRLADATSWTSEKVPPGAKSIRWLVAFKTGTRRSDTRSVFVDYSSQPKRKLRGADAMSFLGDWCHQNGSSGLLTL